MYYDTMLACNILLGMDWMRQVELNKFGSVAGLNPPGHQLFCELKMLCMLSKATWQLVEDYRSERIDQNDALGQTTADR